MKIEDYDDFCAIWVATQETMAGGKVLSGAALEMVFEDLEEYPLDVIRQCVKRHRKTAQFAPTVFDIITMIDYQTGNKHIGVEEAWVIGQALFDESNTVIATPEIFSAFCTASETERYSQAKAFKEKYVVLLKNSGFPEWRTYGGAQAITGGYPTPPRLFNPERMEMLSTSQQKALERQHERFLPSQTTAQKLLESAEKRTGNVVNFPCSPQQGLAMLKRALGENSLTLTKSPALLAKRHDKFVRKIANQNIISLKTGGIE